MSCTITIPPPIAAVVASRPRRRTAPTDLARTSDMSHARGPMLFCCETSTTTTSDERPDQPPAPRCVRDGDLVVVVEGFNSAVGVRARAGAVFSSKHGAFHHDDWIGREFGTRVHQRDGRGFVWVCAPTPELWTKVLEHRTQILYAPDIALVCAEMELAPGSVVLESGTGSGSLTHSLARCVAPTGHVWTYEFNETRVNAAKEEFEDNGISKYVTVTHRDIQRDGFPEEMAGCADAVFLDLPGPHQCVESAARTLRPDGVLCTFSPCIEQVQKTILEMKRHGFADVKTVELLGREYDVEGKCLQMDLSAPLSKTTKIGWRKDHKRRRDGEESVEEVEDKRVGAVITFPRQRLQSHTAYLTFARLVPEPEGWKKTLAARSKKSVIGEDVLKRAADLLAKRRAKPKPQPTATQKVLQDLGEYSD
jgi:tRNA (adenine57-N1/adenine58-N1)-methyltransferase